MSGTVCACGHPVLDAFVCRACLEDLQDRLWRVRALVEDLEISLCRQARIGGDESGIRVRGAETPLVFNWAAAEALWQLDATLGMWATAVAERVHATVVMDPGLRAIDPKDPARIFPPRVRIVGLASWLADHLDWLGGHPEAGELINQVDYAITSGLHAIDRPAARAYAGPCLEDTEDGPCRGELYAHPKATVVVCPGCKAEHSMDARRDWLLAAAEDQLVTSGEASRALPGLIGRPITESMIRGYVHRGKLTQHPPDARDAQDVKGRQHPLYRIGDLVDVLLVADPAERKNGKAE